MIYLFKIFYKVTYQCTLSQVRFSNSYDGLGVSIFKKREMIQRYARNAIVDGRLDKLKLANFMSKYSVSQNFGFNFPIMSVGMY